MHARVLHRVVVLGLAVLGTLLLAFALADMRGLNGRLAAAATAKPAPTLQVDEHNCPGRHKPRPATSQST
jgi:hypothetical protein